MDKQRIAVMFGGRSAEHEISVITALQAILAIDSSKYEVYPVYVALNGKWYTGEPLLNKEFYRNIPDSFKKIQEISLFPDFSGKGFIYIASQKLLSIDLCFLAFHGQFGEDGCIQGLLELADLPYTGCNVGSSSVAMNKFHAKSILKAHRVSTLPGVLISKKEAILDFKKIEQKILNTLEFPLFIKPNHLGSSIGISKANTRVELHSALAKVFLYDDQALVEPCIENITEINVAVLDGTPPVASVVEIPIASAGALSYEDKYLRGGTKSSSAQCSGMAGLCRLINPADLPKKLKDQVINDALESFQFLDCSGVCRFDFMYDCDKNQLYFNEVNPIPGSFAFYLWEKSHPKILFPELIERLIHSAVTRKSTQRSLKREFGFHALK